MTAFRYFLIALLLVPAYSSVRASQSHTQCRYSLDADGSILVNQKSRTQVNLVYFFSSDF